MPQQQILDAAEDAVAHELVERHAALDRAEPGHHPAAEDGVGASVAQRCDQIGQLLGRVLAVAVHHRDEVEPLADGEGVADLLVAAVALVVFVPQDRHGDLRMRATVGPPDLVGAIARGVVDDQDFAVVVAENRPRDALEDRRQRVLGVVGDDEDEQSWLAIGGHTAPAHRVGGRE